MDDRAIGKNFIPYFYLLVNLVYRPFNPKAEASIFRPDYEKEIIERDERDMNREISPLRQADDAVLVDSSGMTIEEVVEKIIGLCDETC